MRKSLGRLLMAVVIVGFVGSPALAQADPVDPTITTPPPAMVVPVEVPSVPAPVPVQQPAAPAPMPEVPVQQPVVPQLPPQPQVPVVLPPVQQAPQVVPEPAVVPPVQAPPVQNVPVQPSVVQAPPEASVAPAPVPVQPVPVERSSAPLPSSQPLPKPQEAPSVSPEPSASPAMPSQAPEVAPAQPPIDPNQRSKQPQVSPSELPSASPEPSGSVPAPGNQPSQEVPSTSKTSVVQAPPVDLSKAVEPVSKPADPVIPPEVLNQTPVTIAVERVNDDEHENQGGNNGQNGHEGNNGNQGGSHDGPPRPGHDQPDNPWGDHHDDHDGNGGNNGHNGHTSPPPRPPSDIDHDDHGNVIINQNYTQVINVIQNNTTIINNPVSYVYLQNWETHETLRFRADLDGRFIPKPGWCGGQSGYWSVSGGITAGNFSAYGGVGGFYSNGSCGYQPPPPRPQYYPRDLYIYPPTGYYGHPVNLGNDYYTPNQGCGCVYSPQYNTYFYGGFQQQLVNQQPQQVFVPTRGYQPETVFQQTPTAGMPPWLEFDTGLPPVPVSDLDAFLASTKKQAPLIIIAGGLMVLGTVYVASRRRRA